MSSTDLTYLIEARPLGLLDNDENERVELALRESPELEEESKALEAAYEALSARVAADLELPWSADLKGRTVEAWAGPPSLSPPKSPEPELAKDRLPPAPPQRSAEELGVRVHLTCIYCHAATDRDEVLFCASCLAPHHGDCFAAHGRCSAPGCEETRGVRPAPPESPPVSSPSRRRLMLPWLLSLVGVGIGAAALVEFSPSGSQGFALQSAAEAASARVVIKEGAEACDARLREGSLALHARDIPRALKEAKGAVSALDAAEARFSGLELPAGAPLAKEARAEFEPRRIKALILRARVATLDVQAGSLAAAQADLEAILNAETGLDPQSAEALIARGELFVLKGSLGQATAHFEEARALMPNSVRARYGKARVHLLQEDPIAAILALAGALRALDAPAPEGAAVQVETLSDLERARLREQILVSRAEAGLLARGDSRGGALESAQNAFEAAAGKTWRVSAVQGAILAQRGEIFLAVTQFERAIKLSQSAGPSAEAAAYCALAEGYLACDLPVPAAKAAAKAAELDAGNLLATVLRAEAAERLLNFVEARELALLASRSAQDRHWKTHARAFRLLARLEGTQGNVPEARQFAKRALSLDEDGFESRVLLGRLELDRYYDGQYLDDAERNLQAALRQRGDAPEALRGQARLDLQKFMNDPSRAERVLLEAKKLDPTDPWTLSLLAQTQADLARRVPRQSGDFQRKAASEWARSVRLERDVRLAAGRAYAEGLRREKLAFRPEDKDLMRETHFAEARRAYRRALWLCPTHSQARAGLASIGIYQRAKARVRKHLQAGLESNPHSTQLRVLHAHSLAVLSADSTGPSEAAEAVEEAIELRGETTELLLTKRLFVSFSRVTLPSDADAAKELIQQIQFDCDQLLEGEFPDHSLVRRGQVELLGRLAERARRLGPEHLPVMRALHSAQQRTRRELEARLERVARGVLDASSKVEKAIEAGDRRAALEAARQLVLTSPFRAESWTVYAQACDAWGNPWLALEAGLHAAWLDEGRLSQVFPLLRKADSSPLPADLRTKTLHPDLAILLRAAPFVARSLGRKAKDFQAQSEFGAQARTVFADLERVVARDPTRLLAHALIGALAFAVERNDYAVQHLLFLSQVQPELGEASYLAAVASARNESGPRRLNDVVAIRSLQAATRAGFSWEVPSRDQPAIQRLRRDAALWAALGRDLESPRGPR